MNKYWVAAACLVVGILLLLAGVGVAQTAATDKPLDDGKVIKAVSAEQLVAILKSLDIPFEQGTDEENCPYFKMKLSDVGVQLLCYGPDDDNKTYSSLQLHSGFKTDGIPLTSINRWNRRRRFSRAYIDDEKDPHLESDLDLEGGVTIGAIKEFIKTYRVSCIVFIADLSE